jgi:hypothetical protein
MVLERLSRHGPAPKVIGAMVETATRLGALALAAPATFPATTTRWSS